MTRYLLGTRDGERKKKKGRKEKSPTPIQHTWPGAGHPEKEETRTDDWPKTKQRRHAYLSKQRIQTWPARHHETHEKGTCGKRVVMKDATTVHMQWIVIMLKALRYQINPIDALSSQVNEVCNWNSPTSIKQRNCRTFRHVLTPFIHHVAESVPPLTAERTLASLKRNEAKYSGP